MTALIGQSLIAANFHVLFVKILCFISNDCAWY